MRWTKYIIGFVLCFRFAMPVNAAELQQTDLHYVGGFRVPKGDQGGASLANAWGITYTGRNTLLISSDRQLSAEADGMTMEISIPEAINTNNVSEMNTATLEQTPIDIGNGQWDYLRADGGSVVPLGTVGEPGNLLVYNGKIYGTAWAYYSSASSDAGSRSHFSANLDWAIDGVGFSGMFVVGEPIVIGLVSNGGWVGGPMAIIPEAWRGSFGGNPCLTGSGSMPVVERTSIGPTAWAFDPEDLGVESPVPATVLCGYPLDHPTIGQYWDEMNIGYSRGIGVAGMSWPDEFDTLLFVGNLGRGQTGNCDSCYGHATHTLNLHNTFPSGSTVTSTTSNSITTEDTTFTISTGLTISVGLAVIAKPDAEPDYHIGGYVRSYDSGTGVLVIDSVSEFVTGRATGPYTAWTIHINNTSNMDDRSCYNPQAPLAEKGGNGYPYAYTMWAYSGADLANVYNSTNDPWDVIPDVWTITLPTASAITRISGAAYDSTTNRLYVMQDAADEYSGSDYPIIHVFLVGTESPVYDQPAITGPEDFSTTESSVEINGGYTTDPDLPDQSVIITWTLGESSGFAVTALGVFSATVPVELGANSIVFEVTDSNSVTDTDTVVVTRTAPSGASAGVTIQGVQWNQ